MYHLELRKFPHVVCRFNQSEAQLRALVVPWARHEWVEEGERKWNANEATLTILEGPKLSMPELAMGKGWRNAQKRSQDVTERVLGAVRKGGGDDARDLDLLADSLGLELLKRLGDGPLLPVRAWEMARERLPERAASETLALAERAIRSLLTKRLVQLVSDGEPLAEPGAAAALHDLASWRGIGEQTLALARRP